MAFTRAEAMPPLLPESTERQVPKIGSTRVLSWSWKRPRKGQGASKAAGVKMVGWRNLWFELTTRPFVGICATAVWNESRGARFQRAPDARWEFPNVKKKSTSSGASTDRHLAALESSLFAQHLPLLEHCAVIRYDDGDPRLNGWLRLGVLGGAWTLDVKDPDTEMSFRLVDASVDKLWDAAALLLACDEAPFSADPYLKGRKATKKK